MCAWMAFQGTAHGQQVEPEGEGLTLGAWMAAFLAADPSLVQAEKQVRAAAGRAEAARTRQQTDLFATPSVGGGVDVFAGGAQPFVSGGEVALGVSRTTGTGTTLTAAVSGASRIPTVLQGPSAGATLSARVPLRGNRGGLLWQREAEVLEREAARSAHAQRAVLRQRCFLGAELLVVTASLQQQASVYAEFVQAKQDSVARTARDVRRGLLRRLELLTAQTDLSQTQAEEQRLVQLRDEALASLGTWLPAAPDRVAEVTVEGWDAAALSASEHPLALAELAQRDRAAAEAALVDRRFKGDVDLVPTVNGLYQQSLDVTGAPVTFTEVAAGLTLDVAVPLRAPRRSMQVQAELDQASASEAAAAEVVRGLAEAVARGQATLAGVERRRGLVADRLDLIEAQQRSAWSEFLQGRLEYQDWAQHFALYQSTRLEAVQLALERDLARLGVASARGALPGVCQ